VPGWKNEFCHPVSINSWKDCLRNIKKTEEMDKEYEELLRNMLENMDN
jgi:hypothetical protein